MPRTENSCSRRTSEPGSSRRGVTTKNERSRPVGAGQRERSTTKRVDGPASSSSPSRSTRSPYTAAAVTGASAPMPGRRGGQLARGGGGAGGLDGLDPVLAQEARALRERERVAGHGAQRRVVALRAQQRERHGQRPLAREHDLGGAQDLVEVLRHGALERVLERDDAARHRAGGDGAHHVDGGRGRPQLVTLAGEVERGLVRERALGTEVCERVT